MRERLRRRTERHGISHGPSTPTRRKGTRWARRPDWGWCGRLISICTCPGLYQRIGFKNLNSSHSVYVTLVAWCAGPLDAGPLGAGYWVDVDNTQDGGQGDVDITQEVSLYTAQANVWHEWPHTNTTSSEARQAEQNLCHPLFLSSLACVHNC